MMEQVHPCNRSDTSADDGQYEQGGFRNTPSALFGFVFVHAHDYEAYEVYDSEIYNN